jgi:hypothetical protein
LVEQFPFKEWVVGSNPTRLTKNTIINCVKKFYSVKIRHHRENIPGRLAEQMLLDESKMINYLWINQALKFKYPKGKHRLDLYADEKYLMMAKMKYPNIFGRKARMGFMELYISHAINKKLKLVEGSTK